MTQGRFRQMVPVALMALGLMAVALACGGSAAEQFTMDSAAVSDAPAQPAVAEEVGAPPFALSMGGGDSEMVVEVEQASAAATAMPVMASGAAMSDAVTTSAVTNSMATVVPSDGAGGGQSAGAPQQSGRQLVVEAWIGLEVREIDPVVRQIEGLAMQRGGWVESSQIEGESGYRTASISLRVPAERRAETMGALRAIGRVLDEGIKSSDVTERLVDNEARLSAWYTQEERLIELLENAATVEDIIEVERRIAEVRSDIEHVEATQRNLTNRVATSLITVWLALPGNLAAEPPHGELRLSVADPSAVSDAVLARVEALGGYIGGKVEYQQDRGQVVELTVLVKSSELAGLMDYAAGLGEPFERELTSVGDAPVGDAPDARLELVIQSNADVRADLQIVAGEPLAAGEQLRAQAESLGGYVERFSERTDDGDSSVDMLIVLETAHLRGMQDYAAGIGEIERWELTASGQQPAGDATSARLSVFVNSGTGYTPWVLYPVVVVGAMAVTAVIVAVVFYSTGLWRPGRSGNSALPQGDGDAGDDGLGA